MSHAFTSPTSRLEAWRRDDLPPQLKELFIQSDKTPHNNARSFISKVSPEGADRGAASPFHGVSVQGLPSSSVSYLKRAGVFRETPGRKRQA